MTRYSYTPQTGFPTTTPNSAYNLPLSQRPSPPVYSSQSQPAPHTFYRHQSYPSTGFGHSPSPSQSTFASVNSAPSLGSSHAPHHSQTSVGAIDIGNTGYSPTGYTPVNFHGAPGAVPPQQFYGKLLNADCEPSEVFVRMCDALFFYVDQNCDVPGLGRGVIEPAKYAWMELMKDGSLNLTLDLIPMIMRSYYEFAQIPHQIVRTASGEEIAILDRRGWLHMHVFDAKSDPDTFFKDWSAYLTKFQLRDPKTSQPFPTPFPRSCLPSMGDPQLSQAVAQWNVQIAVEVARIKAEREMQQTMAALNATLAPLRTQSSVNPYLGLAAGAGMGAGIPNLGSNANVPASTDGGGGNEHANALDAATAAINLTNTLVNGFAGGGGGGGGLAAILGTLMTN